VGSLLRRRHKSFVTIPPSVFDCFSNFRPAITNGFGMPGRAVPYAIYLNLRDATGLTYQAVSNAVRKLTELGILEQRTAPGVMAFRAPEVVEIISAPGGAERQTGRSECA